jgi:hypothetical protein
MDKMTRKIVIIENCCDCPNLIAFGHEYQCTELSRDQLWRKIPKRIPDDCPLKTAGKEE